MRVTLAFLLLCATSFFLGACPKKGLAPPVDSSTATAGEPSDALILCGDYGKDGSVVCFCVHPSAQDPLKWFVHLIPPPKGAIEHYRSKAPGANATPL